MINKLSLLKIDPTAVNRYGERRGRCIILLRLGRKNANALLTSGQGFEDYNTIGHSKEGVIFADAYVIPGFNARAALTNEDIARENLLAGIFLYAKALSVAITPVTY
jgi:hypothetical protein